MGKDIHIVMEINKDNKWEYIEDMIEIFDCRSYNLFGILEREFGNRGIPKELNGLKFRYNKENDFYEFDFTNEELFHHSYVTLKELDDYYNKMNKVFVSETFIDLFIELGGVLPNGMSFDSEKKGIYVEPMDEEDIYFQEFFKKGIEEISELAKKHNVTNENIRMVFAFDW